MTTTYKQDKKTNFSFFVFHVSLLLMFTSLVSADFSRAFSSQIVSDNETGLQWQDNEDVRKRHGNLEDAIKYCETLTLGSYDDWRLPNIRELESIVDDTQSEPCMSSMFHFVKRNAFYFSSTTYDYIFESHYVFGIDFHEGYRSSLTSHAYIRCVRGGE